MAKCPYKNQTGAPGTGFHKWRFLGLSVVDTVVTLLAAWVASWYVGGMTFLQYAITFMVVAEVSHYVFGVQTALLTMLGIDVQCDS